MSRIESIDVTEKKTILYTPVRFAETTTQFGSSSFLTFAVDFDDIKQGMSKANEDALEVDEIVLELPQIEGGLLFGKSFKIKIIELPVNA